jgi:hypothetical protein
MLAGDEQARPADDLDHRFADLASRHLLDDSGGHEGLLHHRGIQ